MPGGLRLQHQQLLLLARRRLGARTVRERPMPAGVRVRSGQPMLSRGRRTDAWREEVSGAAACRKVIAAHLVQIHLTLLVSLAHLRFNRLPYCALQQAVARMSSSISMSSVIRQTFRSVCEVNLVVPL